MFFILKTVKRVGELYVGDSVERFISQFSHSVIPKDKPNQIRLIRVVVEENNNSFFLRSVKFVEGRNDPRLFLYKAIIGSGKELSSPTVKLMKSDKSVEAQLLTKFQRYSKEISKFNDVFLKNFSEFLNENMESILNSISLISSDPPDNNYIVSFAFKGLKVQDRNLSNELYPAQVKPLADAFIRINERGKRQNVRCSVCGKIGMSSGRNLSELDLFKFSTFEKLGFLPDMNKNNMNKILPICKECYEKLQVGSKMITNNLNFPFYFKDKVWVIPKSLRNNPKTLKTAIDLISKVGNPVGLDETSKKRRSIFEKRVLDRASKLSDEVQLDFIFYRPNSSQRKIVLHVADIPPSLLKRIDSYMKEIDTDYKSKFGDWFTYNFRTIYKIIAHNAKNPNMKDFYGVIMALLENKSLNKKMLISNAMYDVRSKLYGPFKDDGQFYGIAGTIYGTLATIKLFEKLNNNFERGKETVQLVDDEEAKLDNAVNDFLDETLTTRERKAYFYLGVLTGRLIRCQSKRSGSGRAPFYSQLKGLRMHESDFKSLYTKLINKMNEYSSQSGCYLETRIMETLKKLCAYNLISTPKWELGMDEANFIFTSGIILSFSGPLNPKKGDDKIEE